MDETFDQRVTRLTSPALGALQNAWHSDKHSKGLDTQYFALIRATDLDLQIRVYLPGVCGSLLLIG